MHIRKATAEDLDRIMEIYRSAQNYMIATGNPTQWGHFYPKKELIRNDIAKSVSYLVCDDEKPHGAFTLVEGVEPTYQYIENGKWLNDDEYVTVHRIASDGEVKGIFNCIVKYCKSKSDNIRIDTHHNNTIMQNLIEKHDFHRCGIIYVSDGSPRIAYQWTRI
jgi:hypothetical protein